MIKIKKFSLFMVIFSIFTITSFLYLNYKNSNYYNLAPKQLVELEVFAKQGNSTAMSKLINYYIQEEKVNLILEFWIDNKNILPSYTKGMCNFFYSRSISKYLDTYKESDKLILEEDCKKYL